MAELTAESQKRFRIWMDDLLDLDSSNPLVNWNWRRNSMQFLCPAAAELAAQLKPKAAFALLKSKVPLPMTQADYKPAGEDDGFAFADQLKQNKLVLFGSEAMLSTSLRNTYRRWKEFYEETGTNILYLTLGMLSYPDPKGGSKWAPLLLVPVELSRRLGFDNYELRVKDDEWVINTTLVELLRAYYGLDLGELKKLQPDREGRLDPATAFDVVAMAISGHKDWNLRTDLATLGIFSFSRYVLWNDLRTRQEALLANPVVRSLAERRLTWTPAMIGEDSGVNTADRLDFRDYCIPVEADSSQIRAVANSARGQSFVLIGPPGTGKSQTIVNIIANSLFHGRTVLFVSEKKAALEVVYNRISQLGLGLSSLELHSDKASKAKVLGQLREVLEASGVPEPKDYSLTLARLRSERKHLLDTIDKLNAPAPFFISLNEAVCRYEPQAGFAGMFRFRKPFLAALDDHRYEECLRLAETVANLTVPESGLGDYAGNPLLPLRGKEYGKETKDALERRLPELKATAAALYTATVTLRKATGLVFPDTRAGIEGVQAALAVLEDAGSEMLLASLSQPVFSQSRAAVAEVGGLLDQYGEPAVRKAAKAFRDTVYALDLAELKRQYEARIQNVGFFARRRTRKALKKTLRPYRAHRLSGRRCAALLSGLVKAQSLRAGIAAQAETMAAVFGSLWQDYDTDPLAIQAAYGLSDRVVVASAPLGNGRERADFLKSLAKVAPTGHYRSTGESRAFARAYAKEQAKEADFKSRFKMDLGYFDDESGYYDLVGKRMDGLAEHLSFAVEWSALLSALTEMRRQGMGVFAAAYETGRFKGRDAALVFRAQCNCDLATDAIKDKNLREFSGLSEAQYVTRYLGLLADYRRLSTALLKSRLQSRLKKYLADPVNSADIGVLKRAIGNNARSKPIRELMQDVPDAVRALCPVFLMSPLSAAKYLPAAAKPFDLVVFDEASQIPTGEAIGPLSRGRAAVICGDPKQLPPTDFFSVKRTYDDDDDPDQASMESVLDDSLAISMPEERLLWHYRSRSESLIAFSNANFYGNSLFTFPSVDDVQSKVSLVRVQGTYGKGAERTNPAEAEAIVAETIRRKRDPATKNDSIGIVTFSVAQGNLIEDLLEERLAKYHTRLYLEDLKSPERIFVKNLESVQGEERDVILFSVCYGPDAGGKLSLNFGPLNGKNGYRRLNVAVSRARKEMVAFASFDPDIMPASTNPGVNYLASFLRYASHGKQFALTKGDLRRAVRPLSEDIARALEKRGYHTAVEVGASRFKVDVAVFDPEQPGRYLLGICIGGIQGEGFSLGDTVEIQPGVLNNLGWKVLRIYPIDWFDSPDKVLRQAEKALGSALKDREKKTRAIALEREKAGVVVPGITREQPAAGNPGASPVSAAETVQAAKPRRVRKAKPKTFFDRLDEKEQAESQPKEPDSAPGTTQSPDQKS